MNKERIEALLIVAIALGIWLSLYPSLVYAQPNTPPTPYSEFTLTYMNRTIFYVNDTKTLAGGWYIYWPSGFIIDEDAIKSVFKVKIKSTNPVIVYLFTEKEFKKYKIGRSATPVYKREGKNFIDKVELKPGKYIPVLEYKMGTTVSFTFIASEYLKPESPPPPGKRYMPIGLVDYGVVELPQGNLGYEYKYTEAWGVAEIRDAYVVRASHVPEARNWFDLQLNLMLVVKTPSGEQTYWVQNVMDMKTDVKQLEFINNIWNLTSDMSRLSNESVSGKGTVSTFGLRYRRNWYYYETNWTSYEYPIRVVLYVGLKRFNDHLTLVFGYSLGNSSMKIYDVVNIYVHNSEAAFLVTPGKPTIFGVPYNIELVFTGPYAQNPSTWVKKLDAKLSLYVNMGGKIVPVPTAYSYGWNTYERATNAKVLYAGNYEVKVVPGKVNPRQVYYSNGTLKPLKVIYVSNPYGVVPGVYFAESESELQIPAKYVYPNGTRLVLENLDKSASGSKINLTLTWRKEWLLNFTVRSEDGKTLNAVPLSSSGQPLKSGWHQAKNYTIDKVLWKKAEIEAQQIVVNDPGTYVVIARVSTKEIKVTDLLGFPLKNAQIILSCEGFSITATTDENGVARVLLPKNRTCTVTEKPLLSSTATLIVAAVAILLITVLVVGYMLKKKTRRAKLRIPPPPPPQFPQ